MLTSRSKIFNYAFSVLLCATCLSSPVMADNTTDSKWDVKQFISETNKFLPYCTLTRQYGDMILAIAKNDQGISNIAIESTDAIIKTSGKTSIKVTLETELINKTVLANPITKSAVLIKLPKQDEMDALMKDINTLTITSKDFEKELVFKMDNIDKAIGNLSLCLSQLTPDEKLTNKKDLAIQAELARKDAKIQAMQKALILQQKQIENAPLYKQAQQSTAFKNLNIANLDKELMQKQEDLNRQAVGLTQQQEWIEKERLRIKKISSAKNQSEALTQAQLQIEELESDNRKAKERIASLQAKQQAEILKIQLEEPIIIESEPTKIVVKDTVKPIKLIKPVEIKNTNTAPSTNIIWDEKAVDTAITTMPNTNISIPVSINDGFTIPRHTPVTKHSMTTNHHIEELPAPKPVTTETDFINKLTSIHKEQPQLNTITASSKTHAPISLHPITTQQENRKTHSISPKDNMPENAMREIIQVKEPIEVETTFIISAPEPIAEPIKLNPPKQPEIVHLSATTPTTPTQPDSMDFGTTFVISAPEPVAEPITKPIKLKRPKQPEFIHLNATALAPEPIAISPITPETTYIISDPEPIIKPIHLKAPTPEPTSEMIASFQEKTTYIEPEETIIIKDAPIMLKRPETSPASTIILTPPSSNISRETSKVETMLSPIPFTNNNNVIHEENVATIPEPAISQPYNIKTTATKETEEASKYDSFLENIMDVHRNNN